MNSFIFPSQIYQQDPLRYAMMQAYRQDEAACLELLLTEATLTPVQLQQISFMAEKFVNIMRAQSGKSGLDAFLYQYNLSSEEGIALMCLAEATLRIPDANTIDHLIEDKISAANWQSHCGKSDSYFVNATSWALMLTGKILTPRQSGGQYFIPILRRLGEPIIRKAVGQAMRILGDQFVMGRTILEAIKRARKEEKQGYRFSYDMLGEAARTEEDAQTYFKAYQTAIDSIAKAAKSQHVEENPGISVKISALHSRYEVAQQHYCLPVLISRLSALALQAKQANIHLTVDAEEADRLDLSLKLIESVLSDPALSGWSGFGLAVQAYQKRAVYLIDWLADLAKKLNRRIMVRLVKGAYWDYEIKDSQVKGLKDYPVFTRKINTDVSYLACAQKLISYGDLFYLQFATHNAYTVAAVLTMMGAHRNFEFQCLKGMGHALYDQIVPKNQLNIPCRVYAPVGQHEDLLPYLVRRLLENGANTSFVNRIIDEKTPIGQLIANPVVEVQNLAIKSHPRIPLPADIFGAERKNSKGIDLSDEQQLADLAKEMEQILAKPWQANPTFSLNAGKIQNCLDPANHDRIIGSVTTASLEEVNLALQKAVDVQFAWDQAGVSSRADILMKLAELFEFHRVELMTLIVREGGRTVPDAINEVREAIDYCRYYALLARNTLCAVELPGPTGESNILYQHGRGVFLCISPWNFPLAIFTGQVIAGLVAGNCVIAKPAAQTPLVAARAIALMHQAGIPEAVVQLLPGEGSVIGAALVADERISGILFTGSTETARGINQVLANRKGPIVPFIAETGGQNVLIADSTALPEQLVVDVITSAFNSAGQRCSALRVLFIQEDVADKVIHMLKGAMAELRLGDPGWLNTDVGPVIDAKAHASLQRHVDRMMQEGKLIYAVPLPEAANKGHFFSPHAFEIPNLGLLTQEVFGPILHVIRYRSQELDQVIAQINATGFGLTFGIHSRINSRVEYIQQRVRAGNMYINRNMIGAVVGVQPFGGEGLSGTGPKAGGPHYLLRLCHERTVSENTVATGGNASLLML